MSKSAPLSTADLLTIIGDTQPIDWSAHCAAVAAPLNPVHNARYAATKRSVLVRSLRLSFSAAKQRIIGAAEGSIIAAIMTAHMMKTASQFANDHSDIGMVSCATGVCMFMAPHRRRSQPPSVATQMLAAVQGRSRIRASKDVVKFGSALVGEWSKEAVSACNVAGDPVIIDRQVRCTRDGNWLAW